MVVRAEVLLLRDRPHLRIARIAISEHFHACVRSLWQPAAVRTHVDEQIRTRERLFDALAPYSVVSAGGVDEAPAIVQSETT